MRELDEMKLARVIDACGEIDGRVKMQKIVYLLKAMGYDLPFDDFVIRQQGPFSRAVACSADILTNGGFIEEKRDEKGQDESGRPIIQYSYRVRDGFASFLREHFEVLNPSGKPNLSGVAQELVQKDRKVLEVAATKVYLEREDGLAGKRLQSELEELKGHLRGSFDAADALLEDLAERKLL